MDHNTDDVRDSASGRHPSSDSSDSSIVKEELSSYDHHHKSSFDAASEDQEDPPPDGGLTAWCQVISGFLVNFNAWGTTNSFGIFQETYVSVLGKPPATIAWIGSLQLFLVFFVGAFSGRALDAGLYRIVLWIGLFLQTFGIFMTSLASDSYWKIILAQGVCTGLGFGLVFCPTVALISTYFDKKRTLAISTSAAGGAVGGIIFPVIAQQMLQKVGFGWAVRVMGFVVLFNSAIILALTKTRCPPRKAGPLVELAAFKEPPYLLYTIGLFFTLWATYFTYYYARPFALNILGTSDDISFNILLVLNALGIPGRIIPAYLVDRFLPSNPVYLMSPAVLGTSLILYLWPLVHNLSGDWGWIVVFGMFGAAIQGLYPPSAACLSTDPSKNGTRIGMIFTIVSFACLTGPPLAGALVTEAGGGYIGAQMWGATSLLIGGCFVTASAVMLSGWRKKMGLVDEKQ